MQVGASPNRVVPKANLLLPEHTMAPFGGAMDVLEFPTSSGYQRPDVAMNKSQFQGGGGRGCSGIDTKCNYCLETLGQDMLT